MVVFSKDDFSNDKVSFLKFDDSFSLLDCNQIVFGFNGTGKSSISRCIEAVHPSEVDFFSYEQNSISFSEAQKKVNLSPFVEKIKELEDSCKALTNFIPNTILKKEFHYSSKAKVSSLGNKELVTAYNQAGAYSFSDVEEKKMEVISKYVKSGDEEITLLQKLPEIKEYIASKAQFDSLSDSYLLQVFDDLKGHYDKETKICPVCQSPVNGLYEIIEKKREELVKKQQNLFYPFSKIRSLPALEEKKALDELLPVLDNLSEKEIVSVFFSGGDSQKLKDLQTNNQLLTQKNEQLRQYKAQKSEFYQHMSSDKEFIIKRFPEEYPGAKVKFIDEKEQIEITLPRGKNQYSTGEYDEMLLIMETISFLGSSKKLLVIDDPLSSFDISHQYRSLMRLISLASSKQEKHLLIFTHCIETINIVSSQDPKLFSYFYIEKDNQLLSIMPINKTNKGSVMSMESLKSAQDPYLELISYRENQADHDFEGNKVLHYDAPFVFHSRGEKDTLFDGLSNDEMVDRIDKLNVKNFDSFEKNTIQKIVDLAALRVWIEKKIFAFGKSINDAQKQSEFFKNLSLPTNRDTFPKIRYAEKIPEFTAMYKNFNHKILFSKKVMLNQNAHYKSQIIPFCFAINISLDELRTEINDIKKMFC